MVFYPSKQACIYLVILLMFVPSGCAVKKDLPTFELEDLQRAKTGKPSYDSQSYSRDYGKTKAVDDQNDNAIAYMGEAPSHLCTDNPLFDCVDKPKRGDLILNGLLCHYAGDICVFGPSSGVNYTLRIDLYDQSGSIIITVFGNPVPSFEHLGLNPISVWGITVTFSLLGQNIPASFRLPFSISFWLDPLWDVYDSDGEPLVAPVLKIGPEEFEQESVRNYVFTLESDVDPIFQLITDVMAMDFYNVTTPEASAMMRWMYICEGINFSPPCHLLFGSVDDLTVFYDGIHVPGYWGPGGGGISSWFYSGGGTPQVCSTDDCCSTGYDTCLKDVVLSVGGLNYYCVDLQAPIESGVMKSEKWDMFDAGNTSTANASSSLSQGSHIAPPVCPGFWDNKVKVIRLPVEEQSGSL